MVTGLESLRNCFRGYENQYAIIGGTACDLLFADEGLDFRATKDIDLIVIVESLVPAFGEIFWEYISQAGYQHRNASTKLPQFYRFSNPKSTDYPFMIELFTRRPDAIMLPEKAVLTPLPIGEDISSLSAILLNDAYYELARTGRIQVDGMTVLDAAHLILFKAKAWLDLSERKQRGEAVDSRNIRKHKNDVFRLSALLVPGKTVEISVQVHQDVLQFISAMESEPIDTKQLGLGRAKDEILSILQETFIHSR